MSTFLERMTKMRRAELVDAEATREPLAEEDHRRLTIWRLDPEESFSDCTVLVKYESGMSLCEDTYHVHRNILALLSRPSTFFAGVFRNQQCMRGGGAGAEKTTILEMDELAAKAFPTFLDYIYTGKVSIDKENVVALHWLADYLGNDSLIGHVDEFLTWCRGSLELDDYLLLYKQAREMGDIKYLDLFPRMFGSFVETRSDHKVGEPLKCKDAKLVRDFALDILPKLSPEKWGAYSWEYVRKLLSYGLEHKDAKSIWQHLTSAGELPRFPSPDEVAVAVTLLDFDTQVTGGDGDSVAMTEFQNRCMTCLEEEMEEELDDQHDGYPKCFWPRLDFLGHREKPLRALLERPLSGELRERIDRWLDLFDATEVATAPSFARRLYKRKRKRPEKLDDSSAEHSSTNDSSSHEAHV